MDQNWTRSRKFAERQCGEFLHCTTHLQISRTTPISHAQTSPSPSLISQYSAFIDVALDAQLTSMLVSRIPTHRKSVRDVRKHLDVIHTFILTQDILGTTPRF